MRVADVMTTDVRVTTPNQSIIDVARIMDACDCGVLPVTENDKLVGMATDRDIVVRALAKGKTGEAKIGEVMSQDIKYCFDDQEIEAVAKNMGELQVRRLPVVNRDKRLVGIVTLGDLTRSGETQSTAEALSGICQRASS